MRRLLDIDHVGRGGIAMAFVFDDLVKDDGGRNARDKALFPVTPGKDGVGRHSCDRGREKGGDQGGFCGFDREQHVSSFCGLSRQRQCLGPMPMVMGFGRVLSKSGGTLAESNRMLFDSAIVNRGLAQAPVCLRYRLSLANPSSSRASGPPPAPRRMCWGNP